MPVYYLIARRLLVVLLQLALITPNQYYTCTAENTKLQDYKFGNQFQLDISTINRRSLSSPVAPQEQYVNQSAPVALKGHEHKLHCFFSGFSNHTGSPTEMYVPIE
uniref:Uncharacterized protein n=1 Tax=Plectus sambesii TaxID=2011161 RepID=A0A914WEK9_9BILA